jgi:hypothetical protein
LSRLEAQDNAGRNKIGSFMQFTSVKRINYDELKVNVTKCEYYKSKPLNFTRQVKKLIAFNLIT